MTETTQDAYVKGYNQGRADEAAARPTGIISMPAGTSPKEFDDFKARYVAAFGGGTRIIKEDPMFKTPDVTPIQFTGLVAAVVSTALAFGVDLTSMQQHVLIADAGVIGALFLGDAAIRHGRATGSAKKDG